MKVDLPGREADLELNFGRAYPGKNSTQQSGGDYSEATTKSSQRDRNGERASRPSRSTDGRDARPP